MFFFNHKFINIYIYTTNKYKNKKKNYINVSDIKGQIIVPISGKVVSQLISKGVSDSAVTTHGIEYYAINIFKIATCDLSMVYKDGNILGLIYLLLWQEFE